MDNQTFIIEMLKRDRLEVDIVNGVIYSTVCRGHKADGIRAKGAHGYRTELTGALRLGYKIHHVWIGDECKTVSSHRVIWIAANGRIPEGMTIDHINRNRLDNRIANLRCVTFTVNNANKEILPEYENHPMAKLTMEQAVSVKMQAGLGIPTRLIADMHGIVAHSVRDIVRGDSWRGLPSGIDS
jgi:hypothetical protein